MTNKIASILDYSYPGISPDIWLSDGTLNPVHKDFIIKLLTSFYNSYGLKHPEQWVIDVTVIGSLTTNRYIRTSDFDCHVVVNIDKFIETNMPKASKEEAITYLDNARKTWDRAKILMPFGEHTMELYIEDPNLNPSNTEHVGRYSMFQNRWLKPPIYFAQDLDFEISRKEAIEGAKVLANELDDSFGEIGRQIQRIDELKEVLQAWPEDKRQLYYAKVQNKLDIIEEQLEKSIQIKQDLVDTRHLKQDAFSENEIQFKFLARFHYFSILQNLKTLLEQTGGKVTTQELPLIEKIISQGSITVESVNRAAASWIDPNGKAYYLDDENIPSHMEWVLDHIELLRDEYGYSDVQTYLNDIDRSHNDVDYIDGYLNSKGWSRIGDTGHSEFGIEISDIYDIPQGLITYLISMPWDDKLNFYVEDTGGAYVQVNLGEFRTEGQKTVNKALSQKRMGSIKEAGQVIDINGVRVFKNPSFAQTKNILNKSKEGFLRYVVDPRNNDLFIWDAYDLEHMDAMRGLGIPANLKNYENYSGSISDSDDINDILVFQNEGKGIQPTSSIKEAFLKEAFEEEPKETDTDICVDFDRTIAQPAKHPAIGEPIEGAKESLAKLKELGYNIIIYSCRGDTEEGLKAVEDWMNANDMPYDSVFSGEKPFYKYLIDDRAIHFDSWDKVMQKVEKSEKKASLCIVAKLNKKYWIDPQGKEYPIDSDHGTWIEQNIKDIYDGPDWSEKADAMIRDGWTRITTESDYDFAVEVADINNLPSYLDNFVAQHYTSGGIEIDDLNGNYQDLSDPFPSLRKAIYQAKRLRQQSVAKLFSKRDIIATGFNPYGDEKFKEGSPYAIFEHVQPGFGPYPDIEMYTILGDHPMFGSTVQKSKIEELDIPIKQTKIAKTKKVKQGDYSCLMALVPHDLAQEIVEWGVRNVPDEDLYLDEDGKLGRELESHITIKYGLLTNDAKHVRRSFNEDKPFHAKLGKVRHFQPPELPFDVLTVEVISEDLQKANAKICDSFECAEGLVSDEYKPHITVAYMKRDKAHEYVGYEGFKDKEIELDTVIFSPHKGNRTYFSISQDKESSFILQEINKTASGDNFLPSLFNAPDNEWQFEHGGPDKEIALNPDSVNDESTWYAPCTEGKPRTKEVWRQFMSIFQNPFSKKEEMTINSDYDPQLEQEEKDALGEDQTLLEYSKGFYDPKKHDFPHNTTWDSLTQDGEPSKPTSVTYSPQLSNEDNLDQNSPGGYPRRFMGKPKGEWFSNEGEVNNALIDMLKNKAASIDTITRDITAAYNHAYWIAPDNKVYEVRAGTGHETSPKNTHSMWIRENLELLKNQYGLKPIKTQWGTEISTADLLDQGWTRVGDGYSADWGITVKDITHIPTSVDSLLAQFAPEGSTITIDEDRNWQNNATFEWPVKSVQQAVNQALIRQKEKQPAVLQQAAKLFSKLDIIAITRQYALYVGGRLAIRTLTRQKALKICRERFPQYFANGDYEIKEEAYKVASIEKVDGIPVLVNPSRQEMEGLVRKLHGDRIRGLIDPHTGDLFVWDAYFREHQFMIAELGLDLKYDMDSPYVLYFTPSMIDEILAKPQELKQKPLQQAASLRKQAEILEVSIGAGPLFSVLVNPTANEARGLFENSQERQLRYTYDQDGTCYLWDAYYATHFQMKKELHELGSPINEEAPDEFVMGERDLSVFGSLGKKAGDQSASVPDYLINEWKTDQLHDDTSEEPYVNHDQRDYPYGMHDSPENTGYNIGWAKDNQPYVVRLDILENPAYRSDPFGIGEYNVTWYDSLPASDGIEATNPE